jgi:hypothetical protein
MADPGEVIVISVGPNRVNAAFTPPKDTFVTPTKLLPVIVISVPPALGPDVGEIEVIIGTIELLYCDVPPINDRSPGLPAMVACAMVWSMKIEFRLVLLGLLAVTN